jgi:uncharacterized membrane protein
MRIGRWLVVLGSVILMATAVAHTLAYKGVSEAIGKSGLSGLYSAGSRGFFLQFGLQLALLAVLFVVMAWMSGGKRILLLAAVIPLSETFLLVHFVGWFPGTELLAGGTACVLAGAILLRPLGEAGRD